METRWYDPTKKSTMTGRKKEDKVDYRYDMRSLGLETTLWGQIKSSHLSQLKLGQGMKIPTALTSSYSFSAASSLSPISLRSESPLLRSLQFAPPSLSSQMRPWCGWFGIITSIGIVLRSSVLSEGGLSTSRSWSRPRLNRVKPRHGTSRVMPSPLLL